MQWDTGAMGTWAEVLARLQPPFASPFASPFGSPFGSPFAPFNPAGAQGVRFCEAHVRMLGETLQRFANGFVERQQRNGSPISLRELYDLWIDSAEAAYAGLARDPAFVAAQSAAINAAYGGPGEARQGAPTASELELLRERIATLEAELQVRRKRPATARRPAASKRPAASRRRPARPARPK